MKPNDEQTREFCPKCGNQMSVSFKDNSSKASGGEWFWTCFSCGYYKLAYMILWR